MKTADCELGLKCRLRYKIGLGLRLHFGPSLQSAFYTDRLHTTGKSRVNSFEAGSVAIFFLTEMYRLQSPVWIFRDIAVFINQKKIYNKRCVLLPGSRFVLKS